MIEAVFRIIMVSGKGGVGKTTIAAATGVAMAARGHRTLVLSFDLAHSLSDSFDLQPELFGSHRGLPVRVADNLDIQEIDVQEELERNWGEIYKYTAFLLMGGGIDGVVAEEAAILPGMEDIVTLLYINQYAVNRTYDVIVVDCPPTSESLRFVSIMGSIDWYVRKRLRTDRKIAKVIRPLVSRFAPEARLPEDNYFAALQTLFERLDGVEALLHDPKITSVRLVTTPDRMVVRETQRAFMYFCLYGMAIDQVVVNRVLPQGDGYFAEWAKAQAVWLEDMNSLFDPVPLRRAPFLPREVVGLDRLNEFAGWLFGDDDPVGSAVAERPFRFEKDGASGYRMILHLPFVPKSEIDIARYREDIIVRIGTFKRNILLPRAVINMKTGNVRMQDGKLIVTFEERSTP